MTKIKNINLEILESLDDDNSYIRFSEVSALETIQIDMSKEPCISREEILWLNWNDDYYIHINASGLSQEIVDMGKKVKNKKSQLFRSMEPSRQGKVVARIIETGEEGLLPLKQKRLRNLIKDALRKGTFENKNLVVITQEDKKKNGGKSNLSRNFALVPDGGKPFISDIEFPKIIEPTKEMVDFYINTLENLARGMELDPEEVRERFYSICPKENESDEESTDDLNKIFGKAAESYESIGPLLAKLMILHKKNKTKLTPKILEKMGSIEGVKELISEIEKKAS